MKSKRGSDHNPSRSLEEIRDILLRHGLVYPEEEFVEGMLEDLCHYAYFTGCITKGEVSRLLGLTGKEAGAKIRTWKKWQDGNRSCQLRENPLYEDWTTAGQEPDEQ